MMIFILITLFVFIEPQDKQFTGINSPFYWYD